MGRADHVGTALKIIAEGKIRRDERREEFNQRLQAAVMGNQMEQQSALFKRQVDFGAFDKQLGLPQAGVGGSGVYGSGGLPAYFGGTPQQQFEQKRKNFQDTSNLRKEFQDRPQVKDYVEINTQVGAMDSLLDSALQGNMDNKVALDQALISMYNKLTDPQSVVRESEYARTPQNLPIINRLGGAIQKVRAGGAGLTDDDRKALVIGAKIIANQRGKTFNDTRDFYTGLAPQYGFDENLLTGGIGRHQDYQLGPAQMQSFNSEHEAESARLPKGTIVMINGRRARID